MSEKVYIDLANLNRFYNNIKDVLANLDNNEDISEIKVSLNNIYTQLEALNAVRCATNDEIDNIINPPTGQGD